MNNNGKLTQTVKKIEQHKLNSEFDFGDLRSFKVRNLCFYHFGKFFSCIVKL